METNPTPIVIVSGSSDVHEVKTTFAAMEAGALIVMPRPASPNHPDHEVSARELSKTVKLMAEVKVVRRWPRQPSPSPANHFSALGLATGSSRPRIVAIGASTGGPPVLQTILAAMPSSFQAPIVVVQHMATGFTEGFADWLALSTSLPVHVAFHGMRLQNGHVYLAPDGAQMKVERNAMLMLTNDAQEHGLRPSASYLFRSVADVYGRNAIAGLLTGMGRDGAEELRQLKEQGAITFVYGMPGEAIRLDAAMLVLPPEKIAAVLTKLMDNGYEHGSGL